jgi:hypothetical protein
MADHAPQEFLREDWNLDLRAELYKEEFYGATDWADQRDGMVTAWEERTGRELQEVRERCKERAEHIGEIIREQQGPGMIAHWYDELKIDPKRHRATAELLHGAIYLAGSVVTYFKAQFNRVRPWVLAPDLAPPIPSPRLPAFPGGHSTQMFAMAHVLAELAPHRRDEVMKIAQEVAVNRERAGLNYPSDSRAGEELAYRIFLILKRCQTFERTFAEARTDDWIQAHPRPQVPRTATVSI